MIFDFLKPTLLGALLFAAAPAAATPASIAGRWLTQSREAVMEIAPCGQAMCGRLVRVIKGNPNARDVNNPDLAQRTQPLLGSVILQGFMPEKESWHGRIYDPRRGRAFNSYLTATGGILAVRGCLGPICQTQRWTRIR